MTCPKAPFPFGNEETKNVFLSECTKKKIIFKTPYTPTLVEKNKVTFNVTSVSTDDDNNNNNMDIIPYDILLGTYPHGAPTAVKGIYAFLFIAYYHDCSLFLLNIRFVQQERIRSYRFAKYEFKGK